MAPTPDFRCSFAASPELICVPLPDFKKFNVVAASRAYLNSVNSKTEDFLGKGTIGIFGKNLSGTPPGDFYDFLSSFFQVIEKKTPDTTTVQKSNNQLSIFKKRSLDQNFCFRLFLPSLIRPENFLTLFTRLRGSLTLDGPINYSGQKR